MATSDLSELVRDAKRATDQVVLTSPAGRSTSGRTCADLAAEMGAVIDCVPDAMAQVVASIDIAGCEPLADDLDDAAGLSASALFLGQRLLASNTAEILDLQPGLAGDLAPVLAIADILGSLAVGCIEAVSSSTAESTTA